MSIYDAGIATIMERKYYTLDGVKNIYYENIDAAYGCVYNFSNSGIHFVCLSGVCQGEFITEKVDSSKRYEYCDFKKLSVLAENNNNTLNLTKFMKNYQEYIGDYYTFDGKQTFIRITDKKILDVIKNNENNINNKSSIDEENILTMYNDVKKTIVSQDEQVMQILSALLKNQKIASSSLNNNNIVKLKENILIYGYKGTGKTEILRTIASLSKQPMVFVDATKLSVNKNNGETIEDVLKELYLSTNKDLTLAQRGVLVIDSFDRLVGNKCDSRNIIQNYSIQKEIANLLEGFVYHFDGVSFDTSKLSVVLIGEFLNIMHLNNYKELITVMTNNYSILPELIGNFSSFISMNKFLVNDLYNILVKSNISPLYMYKRLFESMNIEFNYDDSFVQYVSTKAFHMNIGARGLKIVIDEIINEVMFEILSNECLKIELTMPTNSRNAYSLTKKQDNR